MPLGPQDLRQGATLREFVHQLVEVPNLPHERVLDLLDAQRNLAAIERNAVQLRGNRAVTTVALIRALGGGWGEPEPQVAAN